MNTSELTWFKSSYSGSDGDHCVEIAVSSPAAVHIRDSKDTRLPNIDVSRDAWTSFLARRSY